MLQKVNGLLNSTLNRFGFNTEIDIKKVFKKLAKIITFLYIIYIIIYLWAWVTKWQADTTHPDFASLLDIIKVLGGLLQGLLVL